MFFSGLAAFFVLSAAGLFYVSTGIVLAFVSGLGVIEVLISQVSLGADSIRIRRLLGSQTFPYRVIREVRLDGGHTCLRMQSGGWQRLPDWLGADKRLRHQIVRRLKASDQ